MELSDYLTALRKRWFVVALLALVGGGLGYAQAAMTTPMYKATSEVWVSLARGETVSELAQGSNYVHNQVQSYAALATTPAVLEPVREELGLDLPYEKFADRVSADTPLNITIIQISATDPDPEVAVAVADAVAQQLDRTARQVSPANADGTSSVTMDVVAPALTPEAPFEPATVKLVAAGLMAGLVLGVAFAVLRELLDTRVLTAKNVGQVTPAAVLGTIGFERRPRSDQLVMRSDGRSPRAESYRRLRTNLQFLDVGTRVRTLVVTSSLAGEGKTTTAINLALAVAEGTRRTLLVDADLRRPSIAQYCDLEGAAGLTSVLIGQAGVEEVVQPWGHDNLHVLTSGALPPNPSQLLGSPRMAALLQELGEMYDTVIIDCAPLLPVADAAILSRVTDGALVVAGARKVNRHQLAEALRGLEAVGATCLGIVLNRVAKRETDGSYYHYDAPRRRGLFGRRPRTAPIAGELFPVRRRPTADDTVHDEPVLEEETTLDDLLGTETAEDTTLETGPETESPEAGRTPSGRRRADRATDRPTTDGTVPGPRSTVDDDAETSVRVAGT